MVFPSIFLSDLPKKDLKFLSTKTYEKRSAIILRSLLSPQSRGLVLGEENYLLEILKDFKLSPTALNTYLSCPYKFKLDNLYRIPRAKAPAMCFGTAVHYALELLYRDLNNHGKLESKEDFLIDFEAALKNEILTPADFAVRLEHGKKVLSAYYDHYSSEIVPSLYTEKNFGSSLTSRIYLDDIPLTGKVDRLDLTNKAEKHVRVVDYKTGKPKTRNDIEGKTQNSNGDYKRQLIFYQLLTDLDRSFTHKVVQTEIDFIEPDSRGEFHRERFNITPEEIKDLKKTIKDTMTSIRSLDFSPTADDSTCTNCPFRTHCGR